MNELNMNRFIKLFILLIGWNLAIPALSQDKIYRCGNEYTNIIEKNNENCVLITSGDNSNKSSVKTAQKITGFGNYKIGMLVNDFLTLTEIKMLDLKDKTKSSYVPNDGELLRTTSTSDIETYNKVYSEDVVKFEFNLATGVESIGKDSHWTTVTFYKNKLVQIYIYHPPVEFLEILTEKYGKPRILDKTKYVTCQNGYGAKTQHKDGKVAYLWTGMNSLIAEYSYLWMNCGEISNYYTIKDNNLIVVVDSITKAGAAKERSEATKSKASNSKL